MLKKIEAIIRRTKFDDVKDALNKVGVEFITYWEVHGIGKTTEGRVYRGVKYDTSIIERMYIIFYCREKYVNPAIQALLASARTGEIGDGKIFISDVTDSYRIRTGEKGDSAVYLPGEE